MHFSYIFARILARLKKCICIFENLYAFLGNFDSFYKENLYFTMLKPKKFRLRRFSNSFLSLILI